MPQELDQAQAEALKRPPAAWNDSELFSLLFDDLSAGVCVSDADFNVVYLNPAAQRILEGSPADMQGMTLCEMLAIALPTPEIRQCVENCPLRVKDGAQKSITVAMEGLRIHCKMIPRRFFGDGRWHLTFIEDDSAKVRLERFQEEWRKMAAEDLRAPLAALVDTLGVLERFPEGRWFGPGERSHISSGRGAVGRMLDLLGLYLEIAELEAGLTGIRLEPISALDVVCKAIDEQAASAMSKRIEIAVDIPSHMVIRADAELMLKISRHILNNALKFTPEGGRIKISGSVSAGSAHISFKDTGPGINPEELPYLFDRFHQARRRREGRLPGAGLGLAFCRSALQLMKGRMYALSEPGQGSDFIIEFPAS